jgi:tetratricopeptide (TPR) repeat protein
VLFRSRYDQAIAEFQKALDNGKNLSAEARSQLLYRIGETYRQKGDLDEAKRFFKASAELNPKSTTSLLNEAMIFDGTGRKDQAAKAYEQILKIQPDNAVALNNLAYILAGDGRDYDRALALAERAAEAVMKSNGSVPADFSDTLGWVLLKKNQPEEAAKAFRSALKSDPDNATFHYHLGLALLPMGERSAAIEEFKAALEHNPPNDVEAPVRELLQKLAP